MKRDTFLLTATMTANPDDLTDLTRDDVMSAVRARLGEVYATPAGHEVRMNVQSVTAEPTTVDAEPDGYTRLLTRLEGLAGFLSDDEDHVEEHDAVLESIELLKTHALPEDHPLANR